jgi:hypothetical protein
VDEHGIFVSILIPRITYAEQLWGTSGAPHLRLSSGSFTGESLILILSARLRNVLGGMGPVVHSMESLSHKNSNTVWMHPLGVGPSDSEDDYLSACVIASSSHLGWR